jgi:euchromatic histone-lysine N-methyltransferase
VQRRGEKVIPPLDGGPDINQTSEEHSPLFVLDAGKGGNVSRFLNHSCEPNVFIQCMLSDHHDVTMPRIVMCAAENIHPMQELCYDYGYALNSVVAADGTVKEVACHCGSLICRKRMY